MTQNYNLTIRGAVDRETNLTVADLENIEHYKLPALDILSFSGRALETDIEFSGVRLRNVLEKAGIKSYDEKIRSRIFIEAVARDEFYAIFSFHEVFNSVNGDSILVVKKKNGRPIDGDSGPLQIVSASDLKTGSRYLKMLETIYVKITNQ